MRRWAALALACVLSLGPLGCGGGKPDAKYRIAVIPKGMTHQHWQSVHRGANRAAADIEQKLGFRVDVRWVGSNKEDDAQEQTNLIEQQLGTGVNGIVLAPQHSKAMLAPVERAKARNVPVVVIDSDIEKPDLYIKYIATNNYNGGKLAAEHLLKVMKDKGNAAPRVILLRYQPGSESTEQREKGFLDALNKAIAEAKAAGQPGPTLVSADRYAGATVESAVKEVDPLLTQMEGKFDAIFAPNESSATGTLNALRAKKMNKQVQLMAFDASEPLLQALRDGDVCGTIVQDPYRMGYLGVWTTVQHLEGQKVDSDGKYLGTGEILVTKENLDADATRQLFDPTLQEKRSIEVPGGK